MVVAAGGAIGTPLLGILIILTSPALLTLGLLRYFRRKAFLKKTRPRFTNEERERILKEHSR